MDERRAGVASGLAAYGLWGLFPLYFPLLEPAGGVEIVAHRVVWSLVFVALLLTAVRGWSQVRATVTDRRALLVLSGAAVLIAANWLVFVYGVNSGHVVETSLGYFINPLVSVLLGVVVFGERLRRLQWVAVGIAVGLVLGKAIGITGSTWLVSRFTRAELDESLGWPDVVGLSLLGGIGFTVSLLITELAYGMGTATYDHAKVGILTGTLVAALLATVVLRLRNRRYRRIAAEERVDRDVELLRLGLGGLDRAVLDERRREVTEQREALLAGAAELPAGLAVAHKWVLYSSSSSSGALAAARLGAVPQSVIRTPSPASS